MNPSATSTSAALTTYKHHRYAPANDIITPDSRVIGAGDTVYSAPGSYFPRPYVSRIENRAEIPQNSIQYAFAVESQEPAQETIWLRHLPLRTCHNAQPESAEHPLFPLPANNHQHRLMKTPASSQSAATTVGQTARSGRRLHARRQSERRPPRHGSAPLCLLSRRRAALAPCRAAL